VNALTGVNENTQNSISRGQDGACLMRMLPSERRSSLKFQKKNVPTLDEISRLFLLR
jgi:hypothetical protein